MLHVNEQLCKLRKRTATVEPLARIMMTHCALALGSVAGIYEELFRCNDVPLR